MVAVLFMVGRGEEKPGIIDDMLDLKKTPKKPQYNMASEIPVSGLLAHVKADGYLSPNIHTR